LSGTRYKEGAWDQAFYGAMRARRAFPLWGRGPWLTLVPGTAIPADLGLRRVTRVVHSTPTGGNRTNRARFGSRSDRAMAVPDRPVLRAFAWYDADTRMNGRIRASHLELLPARAQRCASRPAAPSNRLAAMAALVARRLTNGDKFRCHLDAGTEQERDSAAPAPGWHHQRARDRVHSRSARALAFGVQSRMRSAAA
jgi:hypothetical protein